MIVDSQEKVVALNWAYSNADGTLSNQHKLLEPYSTTPLHQVTEELAVSWLEEQLQNTPEEFDAGDLQAQGRSGLCPELDAVSANPSAAPTRIVPEPAPAPEPAEPEVEPEASTMPANASTRKRLTKSPFGRLKGPSGLQP